MPSPRLSSPFLFFYKISFEEAGGTGWHLAECAVWIGSTFCAFRLSPQLAVPPSRCVSVSVASLSLSTSFPYSRLHPVRAVLAVSPLSRPLPPPLSFLLQVCIFLSFSSLCCLSLPFPGSLCRYSGGLHSFALTSPGSR